MAIYLVAHKYQNLDFGEGYVPLFAGAALHDDLARRTNWVYDDGDDSISEKNANFCELTGLYWIWKHDDSDVVGLQHYRRYLLDPSSNKPLPFELACSLLDEYDCLTAHRLVLANPYPFTIAHHYRSYHSAIDLRILRNVLSDSFPDYLDAFDTYMNSMYLCPGNIMVCKRDLFNSYCTFLFSVMDQMEQAIDPFANRSEYQARVFGFLAERLMNVYLAKERLRVRELPFVDPAAGVVAADFHYERVDVPKRRLRNLLFRAEAEGIDFSPAFDPSFYVRCNPEAALASNGDPYKAFEHFLNVGLQKGLTASRRFAVASYRNAHPELEGNLGDDGLAWCLHYLNYGQDDLHAYGFENFDFSPEPASSGDNDTRYSLFGAPISQAKIDAALRRAASQGAVG